VEAAFLESLVGGGGGSFISGVEVPPHVGWVCRGRA
jgi:hypothetical protein